VQGTLQNVTLHGKKRRINKIDEMSVNAYFICERQITQTLSVTVGPLVTERNARLLCSGWLLVIMMSYYKLKEKAGIFEEVCFSRI
jgi:hypothetical protein